MTPNLLLFTGSSRGGPGPWTRRGAPGRVGSGSRVPVSLGRRGPCLTNKDYPSTPVHTDSEGAPPPWSLRPYPPLPPRRFPARSEVAGVLSPTGRVRLLVPPRSHSPPSSSLDVLSLPTSPTVPVLLPPGAPRVSPGPGGPGDRQCEHRVVPEKTLRPHDQSPGSQVPVPACWRLGPRGRTGVPTEPSTSTGSCPLGPRTRLWESPGPNPPPL